MGPGKSVLAGSHKSPVLWLRGSTAQPPTTPRGKIRQIFPSKVLALLPLPGVGIHCPSESPAGLRERETLSMQGPRGIIPSTRFLPIGTTPKPPLRTQRSRLFLGEEMLRLSCPQSAAHKAISTHCTLGGAGEDKDFRGSALSPMTRTSPSRIMKCSISPSKPQRSC